MKRSANTLRIIGGKWRGRKIEFPEAAAIRPTPDRVRETVFNWLQHDIVNARCLDLFAGSGALGLEALSRGASSVIFVEREIAIVRALRATLEKLHAANAQVVAADARQWLTGPAIPFDVVFLDPPFASALLIEMCAGLEARNWLAPASLIYMECSATDGAPQLPANWSLLKSKTAGQVGYHLAARKATLRQAS